MLIGEVSDRSGVSVRMLRHYDALGLVVPGTRTASGYRRYTEQDLRRLLHVECLRSVGMSLNQIRDALDDPASSPATALDALAETTARRIDAQTALLARLNDIRRTGPEAWEDVLEVVALLRGLGSDSAANRQRAVLGHDHRVGLPARSLVTALLTEPDDNVAGALRWALARSGAADDVIVDDLSAGLADTDPQVRRRAVAALADLGGSGTPALLAALADPVGTVREDAALALGAHGHPAAADTLVDMVFDGRRDVAAAEALAGLRGPDAGAAVTALCARLDTDPATAVRRRIVQALGEIRGPRADQALLAAAVDADRQVALTATAVATALGIDGGEGAPTGRSTDKYPGTHYAH